MKQIKFNTVKFLSELIDNINTVWLDETIKNGKIVPDRAWDTAQSIENRIE